MKLINNIYKRGVAAIALLLVLGSFYSCSKDSPMAPASSNPSPAVKNSPTIQILAVDPLQTEQFKSEYKRERLATKRLVKAEKGDVLEMGETAFKSKIIIPENALPTDETIEMRWEVEEQNPDALYNFCFGPHGTVFNTPVIVQISYQSADLSNIDEDDLAVYYYNEDAREWEYIGGEVDKINKTVTVRLHHFSRYALARS